MGHTSAEDRSRDREQIAIVGLACRLPGAPNAQRFWEVLDRGEDRVGAPPVSRSDTDARAGGYLDDVASFDAAFFEISPREAVRMDPQHRILTEATWVALDDAGLSAESLAGSRTGVYTACLGSDYWELLRQTGFNDMHGLTGSALHGAAAGRISRMLDLRGPSMALDATCSSSLLAVHLACQSLILGETDFAVVSGANVLLDGGYWDALTRARVLAPDGRSKFGHAEANGYGRGEGAASVVLRPLDAALAAGDRVHAVILGSGASNNGCSSIALITPSSDGQEEALRQAHRGARVRAADVDYVEAHGTGTVSGDQVELSVLNKVLGEDRPAGDRCLVGSVKTNIGHTEAVSGLVGLIKTVLAIEHRTVPATLHVERRNPLLDEPDCAVELVAAGTPWPDRGKPALAGVSSFGLSGTNVHVVVGEAPAVSPAQPVHRAAHVLPLSARSPSALRALAGEYSETLDGDLLDLCFSASVRRTHHERRIAVTGSDRESLVAGLRAFAAGAEHSAVTVGVAGTPKIVFVFPGQGSQWVGMGRELLVDNDVFARRLRECDAAVRAETGWSVIDRLHDDRPLTAVREVQPVLWAVQVALAAVWQDWGVRPDLVIGHSMGEVAAATVSGALSLEDGAAVICRRSALITTHCQPGGMVAVQLGARDAARSVHGHQGELCVGVVNSAHSSVISGDHVALAEVVKALRERDVHCTRVDVEFASHAPQVDPVRPLLAQALSGLKPRTGTIPMHSTVRDEVVDGASLDADYWMSNLREQVKFAAAVESAAEDRTLFVEISPHPVLVHAVEDGMDRMGSTGAVLASTRRDRPQLAELLRALGVVYAQGGNVAWERVQSGGRFADLPAYPFQRKHFWLTDTQGPVLCDHYSTAPAQAVIAVPPRSIADFERYLRTRVGALLQIRDEDLDLDRTPGALGLDSLLATQLRLAVERELDCKVPTRLFFGTAPLRRLARELHLRAGEARPDWATAIS
ncbi:acyl transferase domain-containing protein [Saccharothrix tamanrassetensis]|uniref:Acyl transferase domain-containing protein n=1 Tax=Saccharothrix tamanrassetensis TaxID=1051531 RepID=A0A841CDA5_9PSEU|nr:type I polyketide synthase [Saccharothrix tamanrassetensis]MBB5954344.1 acyl transferase domain-containing protein [Saccharothrix tamanrassetensis]